MIDFGDRRSLIASALRSRGAVLALGVAACCLPGVEACASDIAGEQVHCSLHVPLLGGQLDGELQAELLAKSGAPLSCGLRGILTDLELTQSGFDFESAVALNADAAVRDRDSVWYEITYRKISDQPVPGIKHIKARMIQRTMMVFVGVARVRQPGGPHFVARL